MNRMQMAFQSTGTAARGHGADESGWPPAPPDSALVAGQVRIALAEDLGDGDRTAALLPADQVSRVELITRQEAVICGCGWFEEVFRQIEPRVSVAWQVADGDGVGPGDRLCVIEGPTRALLTGERTALNFLQTLSGTATRAWRYARVVADLPVRLLDTRKTIPGLRLAQKYAVRCGGCHNHRLGLYDAILIKENHILAAGSIAAALDATHALAAGVPVEIEVESLAEVEAALAAGATHLLLDNFSPEQMRQAVIQVAGRARLEASGGITLERLRAIAETGVDEISIGDLTKDLDSVDLSMRFLRS
jgi:nicotinate-nucleotide pyrophosphorylase (carboxylating)